MTDPRIILLDAHTLCYRAFYAVRELKNSKGQPTNAVFGFVNILRKLLKDYSPAYMAACFDVSKKTKRLEKYAQYKLQRHAMPEDLSSQIPLIKEVLRGYRIPIFEKEGYEADDVLATLAKRFQGEGREVVIVSDDKDMYQLIGDGIRIYSSRKEQIVGPEETKEKFGVGPDRVVDYLALAGDASDNIPGIRGIGEVTAKSLLQEYGSLENILKNAEHLKGKLKEKVMTGRDSALLSYELATLDKKVPVEFSIEDLRLQGPDKEQLSRLFSELEFRGFLRELEAEPGGPAPAADAGVELGDVSDDAAAFLKQVEKAGSLSISFDVGEGDLFDQGFYGCVKGTVYHLSFKDLPKLKAVFESKDVRKVVYGVKDLMTRLAEEGIGLEGDILDVLLAAYLLGAGRFAYDVESLAWQFLKRPLPEKDRTAQVARLLIDLVMSLRVELKENGVAGLYRDVELPLSSVIFAMEREGVKVDLEFLEKLSREGDKTIADMTKELYKIAGEEFNLNSPKQLGAILFDKLQLPVIKRTKTGYSTDEEVLTRLAGKHKLPALILEYRQIAKLKSTYIDALPKLANPQTGRIHCSFNQTGAETGRLSSNNPNLQNIPIRTEMGREIRKAFVPSRKGNVLVSADYSQIELRVLAHLADEPNLKKAFASGEDIHTYTAGLIFDVEPDKVTQEMRYSAKRINFGIIYGMSAFGLAKDLDIPQKEAQVFIDRYFLRYPGIQLFIESEIAKARERGYSETMFKRRRYLPDINSRNPAVRQFAERQAVNTPAQGSSADIIKIAMVKVAEDLDKNGLKARMIITVHDELVFDVPAKELNKVAHLVKETMEQAVKLSVPLVVAVKSGPNWAEMDEL
jgi:DNA polymerase-1